MSYYFELLYIPLLCFAVPEAPIINKTEEGTKDENGKATITVEIQKHCSGGKPRNYTVVICRKPQEPLEGCRTGNGKFKSIISMMVQLLNSSQYYQTTFQY